MNNGVIGGGDMNIAIVIAVVFVLFLIVAISISSNSFAKFKQVYDEYKFTKNSSYMTAMQFAEFVRDKKLDGRLGITTRDKIFSDAYDYSSNTLILSEQTKTDNSISSLAIVSHELGHAIQRKTDTKKFRRCTKIRKFVSIGCRFITPLFVGGIVCLFFEGIMPVGWALCVLSIAMFFVLLLYKKRLLSVEKEASKLGVELLEELDMLEAEEIKIVKQILRAAYMTYVGDFFRAMLSWTGLTNKSAKP